MYKIYVNDKAVLFTDDKAIPDISPLKFAISSESEDLIFDPEYLNSLEDNAGILILCKNPEKTFKSYTKNLKIIEAAGGAVLTSDRKKILVIFRMGKWDLPKGKIDKGEEIETAALREVGEECGVVHHKITEHLMNTYHIYFHKEKWIFKKTYWFMMIADEQQLSPQFDEDISIAEWKNIDDLMPVRNNTYPSIIDVLDKIRG